MTGTTGKMLCETVSSFLGMGMVPKSQVRQTLVTIRPWEAERFTLNSRQTYDSMWARVPGKAHFATLWQMVGDECLPESLFFPVTLPVLPSLTCLLLLVRKSERSRQVEERLYLNALWHILSFFFIYGPPSSTQFGDDTL